jgi:hypothetical protein
MFRHDHYVPILKAKDGEYGALETLSPAVRQAMTPLLEIPPIDWDYMADRPKKTIDQHLKKVGQKIERAWGQHRHLFVDLPLWIPESERMSNGEHPLEYIFNSLRMRGIEASPVVDLLRPDEYLSACRNIITRDGRGACVRLHREDLVDFDNVDDAVAGVLENIGAVVQDADLVFDLQGLTPDEPMDMDADGLIGLLDRLPKVDQWRTFTVTATSFPRNLTGLPPSEFSLVPRGEWNLWKCLIRNKNRITRLPTFGDYGVSHPEPPEVDPRIIRPSASIRYTHNTYWLVPKGRNLRDHGYDQFHEVCRMLIQRAEYAGRQFSWGDQYIDDCAAERVGTGNLTTWRKVGTSHHVVFVVRQLASGNVS